MRPDDYAELRRLFFLACDLPRDRQAAMVERLRRSRPSLHPALAAMLHMDDGGSGAPAPSPMAAPASPGTAPATVGRYRLRRTIASGGMGTVYEAEQASPRRTVAVKLLHPALISPETVRRFRYEAEVLGRLQHPGIAQVLEADVVTTDYGLQPFIAMEHVHGEPITAYVARNGIGTRERVELLIRVCDAVQYAHQQGVIHRDLKPSNILVTATGQPKVLDFGVARTIDRSVDLTSLHTTPGAVIGTVPYMSPEQAGGDADAVDTRSDIYALGVVLFEVLTGTQPHDVRHRSLHEALHVIRTTAATRLSAVDRRLRGDLDLIVAKTLARERADRYDSAAAVAADLGRYLAGASVLARPVSWPVTLGRLARRHKRLAGSAALAALLILLGSIGTVLGGIRAAERARQAGAAQLAARSASATARAFASFVSGILDSVDPSTMGREVRLIDVLDSASDQLALHFDEQPSAAAAMRHALGVAYLVAGDLPAAQTHLEAALDLYGRWPDADPRDLLAVRVRLDEALLERGQYEQLEERLRATLGDCRSELGEGHPIATDARLVLADYLYTTGSYDRAADVASRVLTLESTPESSRLRALSLLGSTRRSQGRLREAESVLREALARAGGEHGYSAALAMVELGEVLMELGRFAEAETMFDRIVTEFEPRIGDDHPTVLSALNNLALAKLRQGATAEAERLFTRVLESHRRLVGDEHVETLTALNNLALVYRAAGRFAEARSIWTGLRLSLARVVGDDHRYTLLTLNNLGSVSIEATERESLYAEALLTQHSCLGADHPDTLVTIDNLAAFYTTQQRGIESFIFAEMAYFGRLEVRGKEDRRAIDAKYKLALACNSIGQRSECLSLLRDLNQKAMHIYPAKHIRLGYYRQALGDRLLLDRNFLAAEEALREAVVHCYTAVGPNHPRTINCLTSLITLYRMSNDPASVAHWTKVLRDAVDGTSSSDDWAEGLRLVRR